MKSKLLTILGLFLILMPACRISPLCIDGLGLVQSKNYELGSYSGLELRNDAMVFITQDSVSSIQIDAQKNILDHLMVRVNAMGELVIDNDQCFGKHKTVKIYLHTPDMNSIKILGSGKIIGTGIFIASDMDYVITGSGSIDMNLDAQNLTGKISGSGNLTLSGQCTGQIFSITGSGNINAFDCNTDTCDLNISGSGNTEVSVNQQLNVSITGSGDVWYRGHPDISTQITGTGKIHNAN